MPSQPSPNAWLGAVLVAFQFTFMGLLAGLALAGLRSRPMPPDAALSALGAVLLGLWALSANRPGNFNIRPTPRPGGRLVQHGPYRWIRHPMYSAVLLAGLATARMAQGPAAWVVLAALAAVLLVKAGLEERALGALHPGYADYVRRTRRFIPGLF
ncbi:methyltransferase family protein [Azohydromonas caseinilytica]|uniref:Protein-S-isoprenylcysteine O-methyltransferase Ste14 n=1 Tax=Azohydromonas caseinilytica TaxID=2728836 RepID=A0A848FCE4_9BURK|nr:isoprenylcysteine carboxylmethyltransferase family protein [Azohydromonas caseinilytica]NML16626.1 hypothetical protein [Azohydromonas caseinilytica]